jgi:hypothetical protein
VQLLREGAFVFTRAAALVLLGALGGEQRDARLVALGDQQLLHVGIALLKRELHVLQVRQQTLLPRLLLRQPRIVLAHARFDGAEELDLPARRYELSLRLPSLLVGARELLLGVGKLRLVAPDRRVERALLVVQR